MQSQRSKKGKQVEVRSHGGQYLRNTCKFFLVMMVMVNPFVVIIISNVITLISIGDVGDGDDEESQNDEESLLRTGNSHNIGCRC